MRKYLQMTMCAFVLGALGAVSVNVAEPVMVSAVAAMGTEDSATLKQHLITKSPFNSAQLQQISPQDLLDMQNQVLESHSQEDEASQIKALYLMVGSRYPDLKLLTEDDYDAYLRVVNAFEQETDWRLEDLNKYGASQLLKDYRAEMKSNGNDPTASIRALFDRVASAIVDYDTNHLDDEPIAETASSTETVTQQPTGGQESASSTTDAPAEADSEEVETNEVIIQKLLDQTPLTAEQAQQINWDTIAVPAVYPLGTEHIQQLFNRIVEDQPALFESELKDIRDVLINEGQLNPDSLAAQTTAQDLLWAVKTVRDEHQGTLQHEDLTQYVEHTYQVKRDTTASLKYTPEKIRKLLADQTPMTVDQLKQIDDADLMAQLPENAEDVTAEGVFNKVFTNFPDLFTSEINRLKTALHDEFGIDPVEIDSKVGAQNLLWTEYRIWRENNVEDLKRVAEQLATDYQVTLPVAQSDTPEVSKPKDTTPQPPAPNKEEQETFTVDVQQLRQKLIEQTPITEEQIRYFKDTTLTKVAEATMTDQQIDLRALYNDLVAEYPEPFQNELNWIREGIKKEGIDLADLDAKLSVSDLLWQDFQVYKEANQENFKRLAQLLHSDHGVKMQQAQPKPEQTIDVATVRDQLMADTPITTDQLNAFSDQTLVKLAKQTAADHQVHIRALYNTLVDQYPEVFQDSIEQLRAGLKDRGIVLKDLDGKLSDADLLWQDFEVWKEKKQANWDKLAAILVSDHGIARHEEKPKPQELTVDSAQLRTDLLSQTPISRDQLNEFSDQTLVKLAKQTAVDNQIHLKGLYNELVKVYPEVFESERIHLRNGLKERGIDLADLDKKMSTSDLLWQAYQVWKEKKQENLDRLADILASDQGIQRHRSGVSAEVKSGTEKTQTQSGQRGSTELSPGAKQSMPDLTKSQADESHSVKVSMSSTNETIIPKTGEHSSMRYVIASVIVGSIATFVLVTGRKKVQ